MKKRLVSIDISIKPYQEFIEDLIRYAINKKSTYTCVANVHMLVEAYDDKDFAAVVNNADMVTPDGMPLAKGLKYLYGIDQDRVAGMDLLPNLLKEAEDKKVKVVFYGGTKLTLDKTKEFCDVNYPNLDIVGLISPPFRALSEEEEEGYAQLINESEAGFVFVSLGCPKQEKWMANMKRKINACMIGIGGALPVMVGLQNRAPVWMQKTSTEWLYRLFQEPNRLFKRYAYTNTLFIYLMLKEKLKR
ncbi:WecB/TagA/CpsF family glycosyltransferase [Zunongwangia atlantica]|uniref:WecB/TagA/CpsF family glycosyl transferase n=1 Tax=Zunongwangia atlantica 22II14-10F7 TaxID=1185767 RepID=A0A1Y1SZP8_9FLAO|nr:WecB/TagA/CpsF family glycosyltransferase [Zunongwangia atlantica]ORL43723.1 WecB/TagA/CpsF family glycosyl transferase [Zunongwangia atlantica 22II14-10F7]